MKKRFVSLMLTFSMLLALLGTLPAQAVWFSPKLPEDIVDVTQYSYKITPILANLCYYLYVETDNPDPTSFRLVDRDSVYDAPDYAFIQIPAEEEGRHYQERVEAGTYWLDFRKYYDVAYEDEQTLRVHGGYIFSGSSYSGLSDGGEFSLLMRTTTGNTPSTQDWEDTGITIPCVELMDSLDFTISQSGITEDMDLFDKVNVALRFFSPYSLYPCLVYHTDKPNEDTPYPYLIGPSWSDQDFLIPQFNMYEGDQESMLLYCAFPYILDSYLFPSYIGSVALRLEPECEVSVGHIGVDITFNGETGSFGGIGRGYHDPIYSDWIEKEFTFQSDTGLAFPGTLEQCHARLEEYKAKAAEENRNWENLLRGEQFDAAIKEAGGTWVRIATRSLANSDYSYYVPLGGSSQLVMDGWVDGRYISFARLVVAETFEEHPTADIVLPDITYEDRWGRSHTQPVLYEYDESLDAWTAPDFYMDSPYYSYDGELPEELVLTREEVDAMDLDSKSHDVPATYLIYDGTQYPGTPHTHVSVSGVTAPEDLQMYVGESKSFSIDVSPSDAYIKDVYCRSSDNSIVEPYRYVSSGISITAKAVGTAVLTVRSYDGGHADTFTVTVVELPDSCKDGHTFECTGYIGASCTSNRIEFLECTVCGVHISQEQEGTAGHNYASVVTPSTCMEEGYTTYTCTRCKDSYTDNHTPIADHTWELTETVTVPSCTGNRVDGLECTVCGESTIREQEGTALGHNYVSVVTPSTCTEEGYTTHTCSRCEDSYTDNPTPIADHTWELSETVTAPTWDQPGENLYKCTVCQVQESRTVAPLEACDGGADCVSSHFTDTLPNAWYHKSVDFALIHGLFNGVSDTEFAPDTSMTRGMLVTVLWRYSDSPMEGENPFSDVPDNAWFANAIKWAAHNGIVNGVDNDHFAPDSLITREQMATILYRYCTRLGMDTGAQADLSAFPDGDQIGDYARQSMSWVVAAGLINGADGLLMARGYATRAQAATILMRLIESM